ncbi:MAG: methylmalonyl-CoA mutase family protein [Cloacibacillus sp.]
MAEERKHTTLSGYELKNVYTAEDLNGEHMKDKLGEPGHYPFTRGIRENMYRDSLWTMGLYSGFASAEEANERFRYLIEQGQTGFSVALDLPTQMGYDSDDAMSDGEVGKVGVAIDSLADVEALFKGIPFEKVRQIRTTANANSIIMLAFYVAFAKKNKIDPNTIGFFLQNDILKEYMCRGAYIFPPAAGVKLSVDVLEYCGKHLPKWTPIAVSGYHIREAGATAAQEIAFTVADMTAYFDAAVARGVDIVSATSNSYFFLGAQMDFLEEVAKFRAARRVFAKIMKERYGVTDEEPQRLKIFAYTNGSAMTAEQPMNNIIRVTIETMAAIAGGIQTLATSSYDEALSLPTQEAVTISLRTQQIVGYESGITETVDPLGGSYAIEALTNRIEKDIWSLLAEIEAKGGAVKCIEEGFQQKLLAANAYKYQKSVDDGARTVVGVNRFKDEQPIECAAFSVSEEVAVKQKAKLAKLKKKRDNDRVQRALNAIKTAAEKNENLGEYMIEAAEAYATLGEICGVLKSVYGKYSPMKIY